MEIDNTGNAFVLKYDKEKIKTIKTIKTGSLKNNKSNQKRVSI